MEFDHMEIEIRAMVPDGPRLVRRLKRSPQFRFQSVSKEDDRYFRHRADRSRQLVLRIRRKSLGGILTFKKKSSGSDTAWHDVDLPLSEPDLLERILLSSGFVPVVRITKVRHQFASRTFEVNVDHLLGLGWFIEVEARGSQKDRNRMIRLMTKLLTALRIPAKSVIHEGYVQLTLKKRAKR